MYYQWEKSIPANTAEVDAVEECLQLTRGTIRAVHIGFPPGPNGLVHIRVLDRGWQIVPWTPLQSVAWDNAVFILPCTYKLDSEPFDLTIQAWNEDDSYAHKVFVGVVLDEKAPFATSAVQTVISHGEVEVG